jgi:hypothetical protein
LSALFYREVGFAEETVRFGRGEALVPEVNREFEMLPEVVGEGVNLFGLDPFSARHAKGEADDDFFHFVFADDAVEELEIVLAVLAVESFKALGGDAEGIGDCDSDPARADVEAENAVGMGIGIGGHGRIIGVSGTPERQT